MWRGLELRLLLLSHAVIAPNIELRANDEEAAVRFVSSSSDVMPITLTAASSKPDRLEVSSTLGAPEFACMGSNTGCCEELAILKERADAEHMNVTSLVASVAALEAKVAALELGSLPVGSISAQASAALSAGWLACDGALVSRAAYPKLFAAIGEDWGAGDGTTTFALPDLRGAFLRGAGTHRAVSGRLNANGEAFTGPALGTYELDALQGHAHRSGAQYLGVYPTGGGDSVHGGAAFTNVLVDQLVSDGVNGQPRVGAETRPFAAGVHFAIKAV
jgi:hypothetical protein